MSISLRIKRKFRYSKFFKKGLHLSFCFKNVCAAGYLKNNEQNKKMFYAEAVYIQYRKTFRFL